MTAPLLGTFIFKVANRCNIDCDYCYVFHSVDESWRSKPARISPDVIDASARRIGEYAEAHRLASVSVIFHGGEPLLLGRPAFERMVARLRDRIGAGTMVCFQVQTNGTLLDERWIDLFHRIGVRVGISLDGPARANDRHRRTHQGRSTFQAALDGIQAAGRRADLFSGVLAVVDIRNDPVEVYDLLASLRPPVIDFNLPHANHQQPPLRQDAGRPEYGLWLSEVFDRWASASRQAPTIRMFEDIAALSLGATTSVESLGLGSPDLVVIESDGSVEGVDTLRTAEPGASALGLTVFDNSMDEVAAHPKVSGRALGERVLAAECRACDLVEVCGGGYLPHRFKPGSGYENPSVYCDDLTHLIRHIQAAIGPWRGDHARI